MRAGQDPLHMLGCVARVLGSPGEGAFDSSIPEAAQRRARDVGKGRVAMDLQEHLANSVRHGLQTMPKFSHQAVELVRKLLCWGPRERLTADEALQDPVRFLRVAHLKVMRLTALGGGSGG